MPTPVPMPRTYLVTGAASGIGRAAAAHLREQGHTVIGADLKGTDISADLATLDGRAQLVDRTRELTGGRLDAVIACAGLGDSSAHRPGQLLRCRRHPRRAASAARRRYGPARRADFVRRLDLPARPGHRRCGARRRRGRSRCRRSGRHRPGRGICDLRLFQARDRPLAPPYGHLRRLGRRRHPPQCRRPRHDRDSHDRAPARRRRHTQGRRRKRPDAAARPCPSRAGRPAARPG